MDLASFFDGFGSIIRLSSTTEVYCDWVLASRDCDDRRWSRKESLVFCKITDTKGGRHNDKS